MGTTHSNVSGNRTELIVYGFMRRYQHDVLEQIIPLQLFQLVFQYYQILNIYGIGLNQFGCLGLGHTNLPNDTKVYPKLASLENIIISQIYKGFQAFLFINYQNRIYATGNNTTNQLEPPHKDNKSITRPQLLQYFSTKKHHVLFASNGVQAKHTFIKLSNNKIYGFGCNTFGQIPQTEKTEHTVSSPRYIKSDPNIVNIQCGEDFSLFLEVTGTVFGVGANQYGQIAQSKEITRRSVLSKIDGLSHIVDMECGNQHTLCLDNKGMLFGFGYNMNGQLAIQNEKFVYSPRVIHIEGVDKISRIRCGAKHSAVMDMRSTIYLFGANSGGQVGIGSDQRDVYKAVTPLKVAVNSFDCGSRHSVVLSTNNDVWTFGFNRYQQCSIAVKKRYIFEPYLLKKSEIGITKGSIVQIIAGSYSTLIVTN
eukprot:120637_1